MIYKGSQKEGKVYKGGTKIGKIYKGNQLVYQSGPQIQLYGYNNGSYVVGMIGRMNTGYPYYNTTSTYNNFPQLISGISGTLGSSNSTVTFGWTNSSGSYSNHTGTYQKEFIIDGIKLYFYCHSATYYFGIWVMEGSVVGSMGMPCVTTNTKAFGVSKSANSSSMSYYMMKYEQTATRNSSKDKIWTLNGLI